MMPAEIPFEQFPGLGTDEYPGFPADGCPPLPDLSRHCSVCADVLKAHPEIYEQLKDSKTSKGVTLARCIKTGIDNKGHPALKSLGAVAGDAESYDIFAPLFDRLIESRHGKIPSESSKCGRRSLTTESAEPFGGYVISSKVSASRNLEEFPFPPAAARQDREEVEQIIVQSAAAMEGSLRGQYYPLAGSWSYPSKPGGMTMDEEKMLADDHLLFYHPDAPAVLSTGAGRHWPHGRGVFVNERRSLTLWINEEEHLKATSQQTGGNVQAAYVELTDVLAHVSSKLPTGFARSRRLGYLTSNPANLGTALRVSVIVKIPLLKHCKAELHEWCAARNLLEKGAISESGDRMAELVEVSNRDKLMISEEETVNQLVEGIAQLVRAERLMEQGIPVAEALARGPPPRGDLTPVDPETASWDAAGTTLQEIFSSAVDTSCGPPVDIAPLDTMQRLAGALMIASEMSSLEDAAAILQQEKAAVKIQALQRGRSERKLAEEGRGRSKAEGSRQEAGGDSGSMRLMLVELLASAAEDGSLQKALAEVFVEPEMADDEKEVLRLQLESSLDRGGLAKALAESSGAHPSHVAEHDEDAATIIAEQDGPQSAEVDDNESLKLRLAHQLLAADMEGSLDASFVWLRDSYLEGLRQKASMDLQVACKDGVLESVLSGRQAQQAATQEALRSKAADALTIALQDGSLQSALSSPATKGKEETQGSDSLEALRCKVACRLESALHDGSLQAALRDGLNRRQQTKKQDLDRVPSGETPSQPQQSNGEDELRRNAAKLLAASCANGAIEAALSSQVEKKQEALRHEVAKRLEDACGDGTLEAAIRSVTEADVETVRKKIAFRMEQSASDGSLSAALAATGSRSIAGATVGSMSVQSLGNLDDSDELRNKVGKQLSEAFLDGTLEAALEATSERSAPADAGLDNLKSMLADSLSTAFVDGSLEAALEATKSEPREKCIEVIEPVYDHAEARVAKPARPPSAQARSSAVALLQVMSSYDRRIGKLLECIQASEQEILNRTQQMAMLQVQVEEAQSDLRSLDQAWERQLLALEREQVRDAQLQEEKKRLTDSLEVEKLKQKHAAVDLDDIGYTCRSELTSPPSRQGPYSPATTPWSWRSQP